MSVQLTTTPELQLKLNSITPDEAARYIALCSMYANQRILDSEYYSQLAFAAASDRVQRICPADQGLWDKLIECKRAIEIYHGKKNSQD